MPLFSRSAILTWNGTVARGVGNVSAGSDSFSLPATFPRLSGEAAGTTTPEELLAASHASCFGIGLRSVLAAHGGSATEVRVTSTITAEKGGGRIRLQGAHLDAEVHGLEGVSSDAMHAIAVEAEDACTISVMLRASVAITVSVRAVPAPQTS